MSKYNYYSIKELSAKREATFYGVILDATFPCKEENDESVYVSTIKVIDHSVNLVNDPVEFQNDIVYITVKSDLIEFLPFVQHIGDIIRIHRGNYVSYNMIIFYISFLLLLTLLKPLKILNLNFPIKIKMKI